MVRKKHAKPRTGFKTEGSSSYLDQQEILGGKGMIYITPYSNGKWYFRTWVSEEGKYLRKSLRTTNKKDAINLAEKEYLKVYATIDRGFKIFGLKFAEMCDEYLVLRQEDVDIGRITQGRHSTIKTQITRWIIPFINPTLKVSELNRESFRRYFAYRKQQTKNVVEDVTIRNEQTTINAIAKFGYRKGYLPFEGFDFDPIKILEPPRRDTFTLEEYKMFYPKLKDWVNDAVDSHEEYMRKLIRDFILLKSNTCMRFGEIRLLQWNMVRTKREEGQKLVWCELPAEICKNRKYREFWSRGGDYLDRVKRYSRFTEKENYVFSHPKFDRPLARPTFYKYWKQLMEFSGFNELDKDLSYYSLRHFGITARLIAGVPIYNVSEMAGTNVQFIEQHYAHLDMDKLKRDALKGFSIDEQGFELKD
tara:strand:+ start:275 stop:1531 length:1257 start_codon:yes stop_codon:yes gene_type:complete